MKPIDLVYARRAKSHGANYSLRIILEACKAGIPISLGFAIIEQESGFHNVWGHDPAPNGGTSSWGGRVVTERHYRKYLVKRGNRGQGGMQGVGPAQLTWYGFQDWADELGGCWIPKYNIRVAFETLASNIKRYGFQEGIRAYNGTGPASFHYLRSVLAKQKQWHRILTGK